MSGWPHSRHGRRPASPSAKKYPCGECDEWFVSKRNLQRHVDGMHPKDGQVTMFRCGFGMCDFETKWKHYLKDHERRVHKLWQ